MRAVAEELQLRPQVLARWRQQYGTGTAEQVSPSEAAELRRLRREVEILRQERDFLKKATAYFANPSP
jgi:transposase